MRLETAIGLQERHRGLERPSSHEGMHLGFENGLVQPVSPLAKFPGPKLATLTY
ncbi:MAG: hypothetical protein L6R36_004134 [Xanthoria steineri]|nr:MAG: hypothetical protein L6R36_004134 [Xanthoria steineri]